MKWFFNLRYKLYNTLSAINNSIGYLINFTTRNLRKYAATLFRQNELDITMDQWAILNITKDNGGISHLTLLSEMMAKDPPTITKMVDLLCKKGYLERKLDENDRRKWNLVLTPNGIEREAQAFKIVKGIREKVISKLTQKEEEELKRILIKINKTVDEI